MSYERVSIWRHINRREDKARQDRLYCPSEYDTRETHERDGNVKALRHFWLPRPFGGVACAHCRTAEKIRE